MAKSLFMLGKQGGYNMTTKEGLDEFMQAYNASIANQWDEAGLPDAEHPDADAPSWSKPGPKPERSIRVDLSSDERKARRKRLDKSRKKKKKEK